MSTYDALKAQSDNVYRDYIVDGVPSSGANEPAKAAIRSMMATYASAVDLAQSDANAATAASDAAVAELATYIATRVAAATLFYSTQAAINADLAHAADTMAFVYADTTSTNNGFYRKSGTSGSGSWARMPVPMPVDAPALMYLLDPLAGVNVNTYAASAEDLPGSTNNPLHHLIEDDNVIFMFVLMGQSLMEGYNENAAGTDPALSTTNANPTFQMMGNNGLSCSSGQRITSFVAHIESDDDDAGIHETSAFGLAQQFAESILYLTAKRPQTLVINAAKGGKSFRQLGRGSIYWGYMLQAVRDAVTVASGLGKRLVAVPFWQGGQGDFNEGVTREQYTRYMRQLVRWFREDVHAITQQRENIPLHLVAISNSASGRNPYSANWPQDFINGIWWSPMALAQGDLADDPDFCVIGSDYRFSRSGVVGTASLIHLDSHGYRLQGVMMAHALLESLTGAGYQPTKPLWAEWHDSTHLDVWFSRAITVDTSGEHITPQHQTAPAGSPTPAYTPENYNGVTYWDDSATPPAITGHTILNDAPRQSAEWVWNNNGDTADAALLTAMKPMGIRFTLSAALTGHHRRLFIATYKDGWYTDAGKTAIIGDGPATGARSCIRGTDIHVDSFTSNWEYDWCIPSMLILPNS